jgi:hypothetical protein
MLQCWREPDREAERDTAIIDIDFRLVPAGYNCYSAQVLRQGAVKTFEECPVCENPPVSFSSGIRWGVYEVHAQVLTEVSVPPQHLTQSLLRRVRFRQRGSGRVRCAHGDLAPGRLLSLQGAEKPNTQADLERRSCRGSIPWRQSSSGHKRSSENKQQSLKGNR